MAEYWYERAAAQGHGLARQSLKIMRRELEQTTDKLGEEDNND